MELNYQMFADANTQTTGGLSAEMKTYYGMELLENAKPQLVHNQFAATKPLPVGGGKTVEWRKFGSFDKALTPLTEGVTPDGSGISVSYITKELAQYGDYTTVSDMLDLTAIDDVVLEITDRHGNNMGLTLDTVTRNEIQQGNQVIYAPVLNAEGTQTAVTSRTALTPACKMTSELVAKAATQLKKMNAPTFDGKYVCIIHPSVAFDLRQDEAWIAAHQYAAATELFSGEIGELHGVRFIENTVAPILGGSSYQNKTSGVTYATYFFGKDAFGIIDPEGGALEMIVHDKSEIGGPLNQFSTIGYKFETNGATLLYPERLLRVMSVSSYSATDTAN
ncbi:MAG: N4-gp56 family major capsid protein [Clostridiales bacterium]|nr:N4-gp56 family major capsid protein [Clostridiales bacterium]